MTATGTNTDPLCSVQLCGRRFKGFGPTNGRRLCKLHLDRENRIAEDKKEEFQQRLQSLGRDRGVLDTELQWLRTEVEEVTLAFDILLSNLQEWKEKVVTSVQEAYESVDKVQKDIEEAEECQREIANAADLRAVIELVQERHVWLEDALERSKEFDRTRAGNGARHMGDAAAGVQQLQLTMDIHMAGVIEQCLSAANQSRQIPSSNANNIICTPDKHVNLNDMPYYLTSCTNTQGFVGDGHGRVVHARSDSSSQDHPLPEPCIFVAFDPSKAPKYLHVISIKTVVQYEVRCDLEDEVEKITGLYCNSDSQLLYLTQTENLTVMDLSGRRIHGVNLRALVNHRVDLRGIAWDARNQLLLLLDRSSSQIFGMNADADIVRTVTVGGGGGLARDGSKLRGLAMHGAKMLIADYDQGKVHRVCGISGSFISSLPITRSKQVQLFQNPWQVAVDNRGIVIVSEFEGNKVTLMTQDRVVLQTLGAIDKEKGEGGFHKAAGLALVDDGDTTYLAVADPGNCRLRVFKMKKFVFL